MSLFKSQAETLAMSGITASQTIELFFFKYGAIFIYGCISVIAMSLILRTSLSKKTQLSLTSFIYTIQFIVALVASIFSLFGFSGEYNPIRISRFFLMMAPIQCGLVIYDSISNSQQQQRINLNWINLKKRENAIIRIITILILVVSILSIFNVYGSPRTVEPNWQVSKMDINGAKWFSMFQDRDIITATIMGEVLTRFEDFNFGIETCPSTKKARLDSEPVPSHFGYDGNSSIAETFNFEDRYLLISEAGRMGMMVIPENVRHKAHRYTEEDIAKLRIDPTATQIYANGEFEAWQVYGK
jgi:hypothetical protein